MSNIAAVVLLRRCTGSRTDLIINPAVYGDVFPIGVNLLEVASALTVEEPEHHRQLRIAAATRAVDGDVVVASSHLLVRPRYSGGGE